MKYCEFNGCTNKIDNGRYCEEHGRSKESARKQRKKKDIYHHENKSFYRSKEWQAMRSFIYERDKGCCTVCGKFVFGRSAHVHHDVPVKENHMLKTDPNNLRLLCPKCHVEEENKEDKKSVFRHYF